MSPFRLAILAVLVYIGYRLLRGNRSQTDNSGHQAEKEKPPVEDLLVEDPVCHTLVPKQQAIRLRRDGTTYYFCSEKCCDQFSSDSGGES